MSLRDLLKPFNTSELYWYWPRAFFPYSKEPEGLPGFHQFMQLVAELQHSPSWTKEDEESILDRLRLSGAMRLDLDAADDYHVHYRNRVNFAKKLGFLVSVDGRRLQCTETGEFFVKAPQSRWPEVFEHQLIKWQFTNPALPPQYNEFTIFPYIFTLSILSELPGNFLTLDEFVLRISLARDHTQKDDIIKWVERYRAAPTADRESARTQIDLLRTYAARVLMLLFAYTPSLSFVDNTLAVIDPDRAGLILGKCSPRLAWRSYTAVKWDTHFGKFTPAFWPLIRPKLWQRRKAYKKYTRREGTSEHNRLKHYLIDNAPAIFGPGVRLVEEEYYFPSSDRANLAFIFPDGRWLTVEVEVNIPQGDIVGLLQAIKYKYMCAVQEGLAFDQVRTALVAHTIPDGIKDTCARYGVETFELPIP